MYNHLQGKLIEKSPTHIVIECGGVGYFVPVSLHTYSKLSDQENCKILVHLAVKEDSLMLFGFAEENERKLFRLLISVSGIGENTARMMLSSLTPQEIQQAIVTGNANLLQSIKGIGGKTAQRVILDLQDKVKKGEWETSGALNAAESPDSKMREQAASALLTLGFSKPAVDKVLLNVLKTAEIRSVEEIIKLALNQL